MQRKRTKPSSPYMVVRHLIRRQVSKSEQMAASAGVVVGLFMVALSLQAWYEVHQLLEGGGADAHFIQINKKVNLFHSLGLEPTFSDEEIEAIRQQPAVQAVGPFYSNHFRVQARHEGLGFYTELFFEAVPNAFLDVRPSAFRWQEGQREVPVILSRDYLALYNFGFAPSHGLPALSSHTIKRFHMDLHLQGRGRTATFKARIVGLSDRINSILVPLDFLEWANAHFSESVRKGPARLLLRVHNPADPKLHQWLQAQGYEVGAGRLVGEEVALAAQLVLGFILLMGLVILLLAAALFAAQLVLLAVKMRAQLARLYEQGYAPLLLQGVLAAHFRRNLLRAGMLALAFFLLAYGLWASWIDGQGLSRQGGLQVWVVAIWAALLAMGWWVFGHLARREIVRLADATA